MLHVKDCKQITVIENKRMNESELEKGFKHLPLREFNNSATNKENDGTSNIKVNFKFIGSFLKKLGLIY